MRRIENFVLFLMTGSLTGNKRLPKSILVIFCSGTPDSIPLLNSSFIRCVRTEKTLDSGPGNHCIHVYTLTKTDRSETPCPYNEYDKSVGLHFVISSVS